MNEIWREVKGFEKKYEVSNLGRVRSLNWKRTGETRILKLGSNGKYPTVFLCKSGRPMRFYVHRLVAEAFLQNPLNLPEVNHKDEDKNNNFVFVDEAGNTVPEKSNLERCDRHYNATFGTAQARRALKRSKTVLQFTTEGHLVKTWISARLAGRTLGIKQSHISSCCDNKYGYKTAYGFIWKYA